MKLLASHAPPGPLPLPQVSGTSLHDTAPWAPDTSVGLSLLTPTVLYVRDCMKMVSGHGAGGKNAVCMCCRWLPYPSRGRCGEAVCSAACTGYACHVPSWPQTCTHPHSHPHTLPCCRASHPQIGAADVRGLVHMTGGGFPENIPRVVPKGLAARIRRSAWEVPALFQWLQEVCRAGRACCC